MKMVHFLLPRDVLWTFTRRILTIVVVTVLTVAVGKWSEGKTQALLALPVSFLLIAAPGFALERLWPTSRDYAALAMMGYFLGICHYYSGAKLSILVGIFMAFVVYCATRSAQAGRSAG